MRRRILLCMAVLLTLTQAAFACGGMFCNATTPVNQAAERILFAQTDEGLEMHVRITYAGPPTDFGWLLPVPRDVEYSLGSEAVFDVLDARFAPTFSLRREFTGDCGGFGGAGGAGGGFSGGPTARTNDGGLSVLAREAVGPYDLALILPETVADLRAWLNANEYQLPDDIDAKLGTYVEMGAAFIALKLLPTSESGDIEPLAMRFAGDTPSIPIVPTSVAATPDMGMLVHFLGTNRAVPTNYRHVEINESAIDWRNSGSNYTDVVSQAIDEAGGRAFTTDFAGPVQDVAPLNIADLERLMDLEDLSREINGDADYLTALRPFITLPDGLSYDEFSSCIQCFINDGSEADFAYDAAGYIRLVEEELNPRRAHINSLFERNPYLTRLYGTMSAEEMTIDPVFGFNSDLGDVNNFRTATEYIPCRDGEPQFEESVIETPSGLRFSSEQTLIRRQEGETVRGMDNPGARLVVQHMPAGQPQTVEDQTDRINQVAGGPGSGVGAGGSAAGFGPSSSGEQSGCDCATASSPTSSGLLISGLLVCAITVSRRRVRRVKR